MGDVLVYMDPADQRQAARLRPPAGRRGRRLAGGGRRERRADRRRRARRRPTWCSRRRTPRSPPTFRKPTRPSWRRRSGRARPTSCCSRTPRRATTSPPAAAATAGLPFVGYCVDAVARRRRGAGGQRDLRRSAARHDAHLAAGGVRHQLGRPARGASRRRPGRARPARAACRARQPEDDLRRAGRSQTDEGVDLTTADLIVCVGRGIGGADNIPVAEELADALGAELAASRPVVDSGLAAQGAPGRQVRRDGEAQAVPEPRRLRRPRARRGHAGSRADRRGQHGPGAAIFNVAHYGAVADLFDVADELTACSADRAARRRLAADPRALLPCGRRTT